MKKRVTGVIAVMLALTLAVTPAQSIAAARAKLSTDKLTLQVGQTKKLTLKNATGKVTWTSSKKTVATVSTKGVVKGVSAGSATIKANNGGKTYSCKVTVKNVSLKAVKTNIYNGDTSSGIPVNLYFKGNGDIPYISLKQCAEILAGLNGSHEGYSLDCKISGNQFIMKREHGYYAKFDMVKNTLYFNDLDAFFFNRQSSLASKESITSDVEKLFKKQESSFDRFGSDYLIRFDDYGIKIYTDGKDAYIPLQTFSDLFLSRGISAYLLYNGKDVFISIADPNLTDSIKEAYYGGTRKQMSKEFVEFNYGELCLGLDYLYGLKEVHGISTFDRFFAETGLQPYLKRENNNATSVDMALKAMISKYIDDGHTVFKEGYSYNSDYNGNAELIEELNKYYTDGPSRKQLFEVREALLKEYGKYYPDGTKVYEEVGDTAFIKFDGFQTGDIEDYMSAPTEEEAKTDTIRLMQYACDRITRENSPIKKVVLDLSTNGGGAVCTAVYVLGTFLGEGAIAQKDVTTGAYSYAAYKVDTNRDGVFDEKDTLAGRGLKMYCITSNFCFSSGNMVPSRFKDSGKVTLIGQTTGGGSCSLGFMSTASGSYFQISSPYQFSFLKNGSFYDVDRGADPDVYVKDIAKLYDRKYAASFIDKID